MVGMKLTSRFAGTRTSSRRGRMSCCHYIAEQKKKKRGGGEDLLTLPFIDPEQRHLSSVLEMKVRVIHEKPIIVNITSCLCSEKKKRGKLINSRVRVISTGSENDLK